MQNNKFSLDFIGIGAEKAGTTWIADCLREHPEIYINQQKEIFFFNEFDPHFLKVRNFKYDRGISWYKRQFKNCTNGKLKGEISPTYLYCPKAAKRIKKHFSNVKIIVSVRNPVDRAYSQYLHDVRLGVIKNIKFEKALEKYDNYFEKGYYLKHIKRYLELFPKKNIFIIISEEMKNNPAKTIKKLYTFLKVKDPNYLPRSLYKRSNVAAKPGFSSLNYLMMHTEYFLRENNLDLIIRIFEITQLRKLALTVRDLNKSAFGKYPKMNTKTRKVLIRKFEPEISKLEKLLGRRLSIWKK